MARLKVWVSMPAFLN